MVIKNNVSSEFADLLGQLQTTPNNSDIKQALVNRLPEMMALAKVNSLALFRLAQIHAPSSPQYKQMMADSAKMGCTNAMLALCEVLVSSGSDSDLQSAAHYIQKIERSSDSYIRSKCDTLLDSNPHLQVRVAVLNKESNYSAGIRFFVGESEASLKEFGFRNTPGI
ncbi:MAG: type IV secretion protein Dot [Legionella sp.]|nr:type IV secretion protein Dot [Legionella sp.]